MSRRYFVVRVELETGRASEVVDITTALGLPDIGWLGMTPEGSLLALRRLQRRDIYVIRRPD